jgi:hypothetical protein
MSSLKRSVHPFLIHENSSSFTIGVTSFVLHTDHKALEQQQEG